MCDILHVGKVYFGSDFLHMRKFNHVCNVLHMRNSCCYTLSPRGPIEEYKRMVLEHTHGLFIT